MRRSAATCLPLLLILLLSGVPASAETILYQANHVPMGYDEQGLPREIPSIDAASCLMHPELGHLFVADSEINEVSAVFSQVGANIFEVSADGDSLLAAYDLTALGNSEPTGLTWNPVDDRFYSSNDDTRRVYRYAFTPGVGFTLEDDVSTLDTAGAGDPEGITCNPNTGEIYVVDGTAEWIMVYTHDGSGFTLEGVLDLPALNAPGDVPTDPEGIAFHEPSGHLFIVSDPDLTIYEFTVGGLYVARYSLAGLSPVPIAPQGLSFGPSSTAATGGSGLSLYVADGGVDNDENPDERDAAIYELLLLDDTANAAPVFDPVADAQIAEETELVLTLSAQDPDGPDGEIRYSIVGAPAGVNLDPVTGELRWTPQESQGPGAYLLAVAAEDRGLPPARGTATFTVTVDETNQAPVLAEVDTLLAEPGLPLAYPVEASDPDLAPGGLDDGLLAYWPLDVDFASTTGLHSGTPAGGAVISDAAEDRFLGEGALLLDGIDDHVSFDPVSLPGDLSLSAWVKPQNIDLGSASDAIVFGDAANANWVRLESTQVVAKWNNVTVGIPTSASFVNGQWQHFALVRDGGTVTVYRDGVPVGSASHTATFTPTTFGLKTPNTNYYAGSLDDAGIWSRVLTPTEVADLYQAGSGRTIAAGTVVSANVLSYSLEGTIPTGAGIDPQTGVLEWTPTGDQAPGVYTFDLRVDDDGVPSLFDLEPVTIVVSDSPTLAPDLLPIADQAVDEETLLSLTAQISTAGDDPLTAGLLAHWPFDADFGDRLGTFGGSAVGDALLDGGTARLGAAALYLDGAGDYVDVGDMPLSGDFSISLWVLPTSIQSGTAGGANGILLGDAANTDWLRLQLEGVTAKWSGTTVYTVTDPDFVNGAWQHFVLVREAGQVTVYRNDVVACTFAHTVDFTPEYIGLKTSGGNYYQGWMDDLALWSRALTAAEVEELYGGGAGRALDVAPSLDVTFSLVGPAPEGASIDAASGAFSWLPSESQGPATYDLTVRAARTSEPSLYDEETFQIQVAEVNLPPILEPVADAVVTEGEVLLLDLVATDPDLPANALEFDLAGTEILGLSVDPLSGQVLLAATEDLGPGTYDFTARVRDGGTPVLGAQRAFRVTVLEANRAPFITPIADQTATAEEEVALSLEGGDPDLLPGLRSGLLAHWPFDADFSSTTGFHDGLAQGGAALETLAGEVFLGDGALLLDGVDGYVDFGELALTGDFSVAGWVRPANLDSLTASGAIVLGDAANANWLRLELDGVRMKWDNATTVLPTTDSFVNGVWQHFALVRRDGVVEAYRNGALIASGTKAETFTPSFIGLKTPNTNHYQGLLDDLALWARALAPEEITRLQGAGAGLALTGAQAPPKDTVAWSLVEPVPPGAQLDPLSGAFSWTPSLEQAGQSHEIIVQLQDDALPSLAARDTFVTWVQWPGEPPVCFVEPDSLFFPTTTAVPDTNRLQLVLRNVGGGLLIGAVSSDDPGLILESGAGEYSLAGGDSLVIQAAFVPDAAGTWSGAIQTGSSCGEIPWEGVAVEPTGVDSPPRVTRLLGNAPNPFNPRTSFSFTLDEEQAVALRIFDSRGRLIKTVVDEVLPAGAYDGTWTWDGRDERGRVVRSGTYFYRLSTGRGYVESRKMTLLK